MKFTGNNLKFEKRKRPNLIKQIKIYGEIVAI